jgi:uncharacterized OB-fold protein
MERPLPLPDAETAFFWDGARAERLLINRCSECGFWIHPPKPSCPRCGSGTIAPAAVGGRGVVHTYTVTHTAIPGFEPPFAVVLVELEEQAGLRLVSNLVDVPPDDVAIGMPVEVVFRAAGAEVTLPLFAVRRES